jgi:hypothetical protein
MMAKFTKAEIEVSRGDRIDEVADLARRYACPAIVVQSDMVSQAVLARTVKQGKFKIICTVDCPKGEQYCREKFRGIMTEALSADGFEVMITARDNYGDIHTELVYLSKFFSSYFNQLTEFRPVLGFGMPGRSAKIIENILTSCTKIPMPAMVRTIPGTKPYSDANLNDVIAAAKKFCSIPVKVSGNITLETYNSVKADRFALSVQQFKDMLKPAAPKIEKPQEPEEV